MAAAYHAYKILTLAPLVLQYSSQSLVSRFHIQHTCSVYLQEDHDFIELAAMKI